jgi:hypothetical protein
MIVTVDHAGTEHRSFGWNPNQSANVGSAVSTVTVTSDSLVPPTIDPLSMDSPVTAPVGATDIPTDTTSQTDNATNATQSDIVTADTSAAPAV